MRYLRGQGVSERSGACFLSRLWNRLRPSSRQEIETKKSIVSLFLARFTLTEEEIQCMTSRDVPMGLAFFQALDKTEQIRTDCRVLMSGEDGPTKAGYALTLGCYQLTDSNHRGRTDWISWHLPHPI